MSSFLPSENYSISENPKFDIWNSFITNNSPGDLWQTIDYAESLKQLRRHTKTVRLIVSKNGVPECIAQGTFSKIIGFGTVINIHEGPLLSTVSKNNSSLLKYTISAMEKFAAKNRVMGIKVLWPCKWGHIDLFVNMGYKQVGKNFPYTVDLSRGADDLWKRINGNKRRNIKKAINRGVEFTESRNFENIEKFYNLYVDLAQRHNYVAPALSWFQTMWNSRSAGDSSKVFFAKWRGNNISSVFVTMNGKTIYALGWGYLGEDLEVRPNDFLHWKIMEWGSKRGLLKYHMGDVHPEVGASEGGTWRWKKEWNGDMEDVYVFRKSLSKYGFIERIYNRMTKQ